MLDAVAALLETPRQLPIMLTDCVYVILTYDEGHLLLTIRMKVNHLNEEHQLEEKIANADFLSHH